jgi:hypothetical protein
MTVQDAIQAEMARYLKACADHRVSDAHRHLAAMKRLGRTVVTTHERLKMLAGV